MTFEQREAMYWLKSLGYKPVTVSGYDPNGDLHVMVSRKLDPGALVLKLVKYGGIRRVD